MAILSLMLNCNPNNTHPISPRIKPPPFFSQINRPNTSFHPHYAPTNTRKKTHFNSAGYSYLSTPNTPKDKGNEEKDSDQVDVLKKWRSFLPGGSWWNLLYDSCNQEDESSGIPVKPFTVLCVFRRMWALVVVNDDDKWLVYVAFVSLTIAALLEVSVPSLLAASIFSAGRRDHMVFCKNVRVLTVLCITSGICSGLRSGCFAVINTNLLKRLREILYSAFIFQDIPFFDKETVGGLSSRLGADCQRLSNIIGNDVNLILRYVIQGMGALLNLVILSWPLALSTLVICSILSSIFLIYGQYQKEAAKVTQDIIACANEVSHETFSSIRTVRACGMERHEFERYKWWLDKLAFIGMRESAAYGIWNLSFNSLYRFTQVFAILLGGMSILTGHTTPEQLTKYVFYCEWLIYAAWRVQDNLSSLLQSIGASEKVLQLMDLLPGDQFLSKGVKLQKLMGYIEFVNVSFNYPSRVSILEHVTISVKANEVVAIAGLSGSGKSTLVNLLLRLYEPNEGKILIDSVPLKELDIKFLRENIGYVGQEPQLFHMDIKSNIMYGCPTHITHEDVERAAKQAYAHDFILSLPNGYETVVDDELLSGGQKQRIAIARAILRDPAILILDEATSALDADSEYNIKGILHGLRNGRKEKRTVIVIAHRLSTIRAADRIIVMKGGQVVEMGNHMELLNQNGLYARLNGLQKDVLAS